MWLLDMETLTLEEVLGPETDQCPPYAILSHTWNEGEVSFHEIQNVDDTIRAKAGYAKICGFVAKAREDGFRYVWIDTCCIDKKSSAELSESINSMYNWYKAASVCYAYLVDVPASYYHSSEDEQKSLLSKSRWFTRGWTLQELLAPRTVEFYAVDWSEIGTKASMCDVLAEITRIPTYYLIGNCFHHAPVAIRMSWAATRITTRVEDEAYSLMGLFNVNMPLIYGEGKKAFRRLQEEVLKTNPDYSLFSWGRKTCQACGLEP
ncbi:HET-domain-containing protein [Xylariomycetidae sp. FL2044]|nr:HET-domain-containing protein [Xylariomycetidae sp. FL2044]